MPQSPKITKRVPLFACDSASVWTISAEFCAPDRLSTFPNRGCQTEEEWVVWRAQTAKVSAAV